MKKKTDEGLVSGPIELTDRQKAARERDCKVTYGRAVSYPGISAKVEGLVQERMEAGLDLERRALWCPEEVLTALPAWAPTLTPAVDRMLGADMALVARFMTTVSRGDRTAIVKKITANVCRLDSLLGAKIDGALVEARVWDQLFRMQKDQGVVLKSEIKKLLA